MSSGTMENLSVENGVLSSGSEWRGSRCLEIWSNRCVVCLGAIFSDAREARRSQSRFRGSPRRKSPKVDAVHSLLDTTGHSGDGPASFIAGPSRVLAGSVVNRESGAFDVGGFRMSWMSWMCSGDEGQDTTTYGALRSVATSRMYQYHYIRDSTVLVICRILQHTIDAGVRARAAFQN